ncbi:relaxase domain-containing protein (plasmid) [Clavibacter nebraskensis]|nr:relaxase domain-containing protein [Clavibacter nebraskensis]
MTDPVTSSPTLLELTFDVPRSVSVLWATQSEEIRVLLTETVLRAVDDTLQDARLVWVFARRGAGGVAQVDVASPIAGCAFPALLRPSGKAGPACPCRPHQRGSRLGWAGLGHGCGHLPVGGRAGSRQVRVVPHVRTARARWRRIRDLLRRRPPHALRGCRLSTRR